MLEIFRCPIDKRALIQKEDTLICSCCHLRFSQVDVEGKRNVYDFRCFNQVNKVQIEFNVPQSLLDLDSETIKRFGFATKVDFKCLSREEIRKKFGTKLQKEILYYIEKTYFKVSSDARILDLGCGTGGNKNYLNSIGFKNVISVDYWSVGADYLVDVHRLPFDNSSFDLILTTATLEHFYNPFIAFAEMSRVLKSGGVLVASGSFWESWHGQSCFHFTPNGLFVLCQSANLILEDLWSGWGFIPSISSHAFGLERWKFVTYKFQDVFDFLLKLLKGNDAVLRHRLRTSGSFGIYCIKP